MNILEIENDGIAIHTAKIKLNGTPLVGFSSFKLSSDLNNKDIGPIFKLTLEMYIHKMKIKTPIMIDNLENHLPEEFIESQIEYLGSILKQRKKD